MKKIVFIVVIINLFMGSIYSQHKIDAPERISESSIPQTVQKAFNKQYQEAKNVRWTITQQGEFQANFKLNNENASVTYSYTGNLIESKIPVKFDEIPGAVKKSFNDDYSGYTIKNIKQRISSGRTNYLIKAGKKMNVYEFTYDPQGNLLQKEMIKRKQKEG